MPSAMHEMPPSLRLNPLVQTIMGGKSTAVSPDEYVFASVQIYMDVIFLFLYILSICEGGGGHDCFWDLRVLPC